MAIQHHIIGRPPATVASLRSELGLALPAIPEVSAATLVQIIVTPPATWVLCLLLDGTPNDVLCDRLRRRFERCCPSSHSLVVIAKSNLSRREQSTFAGFDPFYTQRREVADVCVPA